MQQNRIIRQLPAVPQLALSIVKPSGSNSVGACICGGETFCAFSNTSFEVYSTLGRDVGVVAVHVNISKHDRWMGKYS